LTVNKVGCMETILSKSAWTTAASSWQSSTYPQSVRISTVLTTLPPTSGCDNTTWVSEQSHYE
jgi:hypothetical protein